MRRPEANLSRVPVWPTLRVFRLRLTALRDSNDVRPGLFLSSRRPDLSLAFVMFVVEILYFFYHFKTFFDDQVFVEAELGGLPEIHQ
jgi:hypothetical protein